MAAKLIWSAIAMLACAPCRGPLFLPRKYSEKDTSMKSLLSKEEIQERVKADDGLLGADQDVMVSLDKCEGRRSRHRLLPNRVSWENRPKWGGNIIGLTPLLVILLSPLSRK